MIVAGSAKNIPATLGKVTTLASAAGRACPARAATARQKAKRHDCQGDLGRSLIREAGDIDYLKLIPGPCVVERSAGPIGPGVSPAPGPFRLETAVWLKCLMVHRRAH